MKFRSLQKWEFYSTAAEVMMTYVENEEDIDITPTGQQNTSHTPLPATSDPSLKVPTCLMCSMEESVQRKSMNMANKRGIHYSRRKSFLAACSCPMCNIVAHTCSPLESRIDKIP